jgi:hypothetical protein
MACAIAWRASIIAQKFLSPIPFASGTIHKLKKSDAKSIEKQVAQLYISNKSTVIHVAHIKTWQINNTPEDVCQYRFLRETFLKSSNIIYG